MWMCKVWRSWEKPVSYRVYSTQISHYSSILNKEVHGYGEMPKVEEMLASYLSPESSWSARSPLTVHAPLPNRQHKECVYPHPLDNAGRDEHIS